MLLVVFRIPRAEVEEIANEVLARLAKIGRGFEYTICGGFVLVYLVSGWLTRVSIHSADVKVSAWKRAIE